MPISEPAPPEALAHALLAERGLQLFRDPSTGPGADTRHGIGYVRAATAPSTSGAPGLHDPPTRLTSRLPFLACPAIGRWRGFDQRVDQGSQPVQLFEVDRAERG